MELDRPDAGPPGFGTLLRRHRLAAGLSQEGLAERARMSVEGISALERGFRRAPQRETLGLLAGALALAGKERQIFEAAAAKAASRRPRGFASITVGPWPRSRAAALPIAITSFVGRDKELAEVCTLLREHRFVTITGSGGIGKTQTALQAAARLHEAGDAVSFIALAPVVDSSLVTTAIASALGVQEASNQPLLETLTLYLRDKTLLLILDNCEQVVAEAGRLAAEILIASPRVRVLATSRERLKTPGEHAFRLPSLRAPSRAASDALNAAEACSYAAVQLFVDRATAVDHRFALTDENASNIAELCRRLDGIPLAIELAAARTNLLSVKGIVAKLDDRLSLLADGARTALPRQQTMRAAIEWSYNLLTPGEQRFFERLAVFAGGCTLAAAVAVCEEDETEEVAALDTLGSLVDKSLVLVEMDASEPRYALLESFREYARERLTERGEFIAVSQRHARTFLDLARQLDTAYHFAADEVWIELAETGLDNWRAALTWTLTKRGDVELGQRLVGDLIPLWVQIATPEGKRWIDTAFALVDEGTPVEILAKLEHARAAVTLQRHEYDVTLPSSRLAVERYRIAGDNVGVVRALTLEGFALFGMDRFAEAKQTLEQALAQVATLNCDRDAGMLHFTLGVVAQADGDVTAARDHLLQARGKFESTESMKGVAGVVSELSRIEFLAGNVELALTYAVDGWAIMRRSIEKGPGGLTRSLAISGLYVCQCLAALTRYDEAELAASEALAIARELEDALFTAAMIGMLGIFATLRAGIVCRRDPNVCRRAARILGFANARTIRLGVSVLIIHSESYESTLAALRETLGAEPLADLMTAGAAMSEDQALFEISAMHAS